MGFGIDRRPGTALGFLFGHAAVLIAFLDMARLALLLVRVARLVAAGHDALLLEFSFRERRQWVGGSGPAPPSRKFISPF
jgi:hypothetical protein